MKIICIEGKDGIEKHTLVDDEDYDNLNKYKWYLNSRGYVANIYGIMMHRLLMNATKGVLVDHKDGDPMNNRKNNLRFATISQNAMNSKKKRGASKYKSVWKRSDKKRLKIWAAEIVVNSKKVCLGTYKTEEEAALAYNEAAVKHFGEFARLNVID